MKTKLPLLLFVSALPVLARSKPVEGFSAYLLGEPAAESVFVGAIPIGESAVCALAETPEGNVLGGTRVTRGKIPWLFLFDAKAKRISRENVWPLSKFIQGQRCISALAAAADGKIYGATTNLHEIDYEAEEDVIKAYEGSHLFSVKTGPKGAEVKDLGVPFPGEGIQAMVSGKDGKTLYGVTVPSQIFFGFDPASGKAEKLFQLPGVELELNRYIGKSTRALVLDNAGNIYGSWHGGRMFRFDVKKKAMDTLKTELPTNGGTAYDCVTALTRTRDGRIFGGTLLDGKLFEFLPKSEKIVDLGITGRTGNVTGLAEKDGILYGLSGGKSSLTRVFAYRIKTGEYYVYPSLKVYFENTPAKHKKEQNQLKNLLLLKSGMLASGDDESSGHFYTFEPQKIDWAR